MSPELVEIERILVIDSDDHMNCSWCGSRQLTLRAVAARPETFQPDDVSMLMRCEECRVAFFVLLLVGPDGIAVKVEQA